MTEAPLTPARFSELADAYGSNIARWPETVQADARRFAADPAMRAILDHADWLDERLDSWTIAPTTAALRARVLASWRRPLSRRARLWWSGLGIATALAGAAAGSIAAAAAVPTDHAPSEEATAFGDLNGQEA